MSKETQERVVTKSVKVARLLEPKFVSLVGSPANATAFKVIRKDKDMSKSSTKVARTRTVRRMDAALMVLFPAGTDDDTVHATMSDFGLSEYEIRTEADGSRIVVRSDVKEFPTKYTTITLRDGIKARVAQPVVTPTDEDPLPHVSVVRFEFSAESFDDHEVSEWLQRHGIDTADAKIVSTESSISVIRSEISADIEIKRLQIDEGVDVVLRRSADLDIPGEVVDVVSEKAYGSWGWGQLDFTASMADVEFSQLSRTAMDRLEGVLNQILFYSYLPVSVRKELVVRASSQFATYINALLDSLPARVMMIYRSDQKEKQTMKREDKQEVPTEKKDEGTPASDGEFIKRSELPAMIMAGVAAALKEAGVTRSDASDGKKKDEESAAPPASSAEEMGKQIAEAVRSSIKEVVEPLAASLSSLSESVKVLEGSTVVRSDGGDGKQKTRNGDVFTGVFSRSSAKAS